MLGVDVSIVTFRPDLALLTRLLASVVEQAAGLEVAILVLDNSPDPTVAQRISTLPVLETGVPVAVDMQRSNVNVGFGRGHNANAARGGAPWLLVLNQDCLLEPGVLRPLLSDALADADRVAAWELRQIPYEHPKAYDPVTLDVPWVSGAATLFRRRAFDEVGGFDRRIFMYGEDVDLSWRLRSRGWRLRYLPRHAVVHRTYASAGEVKPLQVLGGVRTNLCLRARFGGLARTLQGLAMVGAEMLGPQDFAGRRMGLLGAAAGFVAQWPHFARTRVRPGGDFHPTFSGWGYETRRDGAFVELRSSRERPRAQTPLVSILIRTVGRGARLDEALASVANQVWPAVEAVVVEDGPASAEAIVARYQDRLPIEYVATGRRVGRARAGNLALARARGEWLNFLDDDDLLFADHVEVLMETVQATGLKGAYALAWETAIEGTDSGRGNYRETAQVTRHRQPFDRLTLWHHNYLPIQSVLFHRSLYERHGGFAEDMDQLEDWNLWTRYTLEADFALVEKTTSKYRVPAGSKDSALRQVRLDRAYTDALARQHAMRMTLSPREISQMADAYMRTQALLVVSRPDVRRFVGAHPWLARVAAWRRAPLARFARLRARRRGAG